MYTMTTAGEVDDPVLEQLDHDERELGLMSGKKDVPPAKADLRPFDVEVPRPRAIPLERLYKLIDQKLPPEVEAMLETRAPLLIHQGLTAFNPPGRAPASVWGLGYEVRLEKPDADTLSIQPSTELLEVAKLDQEVSLGLAAGGALEPPKEALQLANLVPGLTLNGVKIAATTQQSFKLAIKFRFELLKIQSGPVGAGGARWNFYRQDDRLDGFQPLLHTIAVPRKTKSLQMKVKTWVVRAGGWFGLKKPIRWESEEIAYDVPVEGLAP